MISIVRWPARRPGGGCFFVFLSALLLCSIGCSLPPLSDRIQPPTFQTGRESVLLINPTAPLSEDADRCVSDPLFSRGKEASFFFDVTEALRLSANDPAIHTLLLDLSALPVVSMAHSLELHSLLKKNQEQGKQVVAFSYNYNQDQYFLASAADTVCMEERGECRFTGFSFQTFFFGETFQRFHIGMDVFQSGRFKSGAEPYLRSSFSEPAAADLREILSETEALWLQTVGKNRSFAPPYFDLIAYRENYVAELQREKAAALSGKSTPAAVRSAAAGSAASAPADSASAASAASAAASVSAAAAASSASAASADSTASAAASASADSAAPSAASGLLPKDLCARLALRFRLLDRVVSLPYQADIRDRLAALGVEGTAVDFSDYLKRKRYRAPAQIAVVTVEGPLFESGDSFSQATSADSVAEKITHAFENPAVKGVVLRINSPGGSAVTAQSIYETLQEARRDRPKPMAVSLGETAASGGYWIALLGKTVPIFATEASLTGSIGVYGVVPNVAEALNRYFSLHLETVTAGRGPTPTAFGLEPLTADDRAWMQLKTEGIYSQFKQLLMDSRQFSAAEAEERAGGRLFLGEKARELRLIDSVGGLSEAVQWVAQEAKIRRYQINFFKPSAPKWSKRLLLRLLASLING